MIIGTLAFCPENGVWPRSEKGKTVELECQGELIGPLLRRCGLNGVWEEVNYDYCLPRYPPHGKSHVDIIYLISHAHDYIIAKKPEGWVTAMKSVYPILQNYSIGLYRIAKVSTNVSLHHFLHL